MKRSIPIPLYYQVKEDIISKIKNGTYGIGDKVPGENELQKVYNVSSITVRKALMDLVNEGYLYRFQGKGTYVAKPKINRLLNLMSFTDEMKEKGIQPSTKIIHIKTIVDEVISKKLEISEDSEITVVKRLRLADGVPIALQTSYVPASILTSEVASRLKQETSLYAILKEKGIMPHSAREVYNIITMEDKATYSLFKVKKGTPAFYVRRTTYNREEIVFEYAESILIWDRYSIEVDLKSKY